jgi:hypothetical protein
MTIPPHYLYEKRATQEYNIKERKKERDADIADTQTYKKEKKKEG